MLTLLLMQRQGYNGDVSNSAVVQVGDFLGFFTSHQVDLPWSQKEGKASDMWVLPSSFPVPRTHHCLSDTGTPSGRLGKRNLEEAPRGPAPS